MRIFSRHSRGFTLIELSVVIVIIAVIIGMSVSSGLNMVSQARVQQTTDKIAVIKQALMTYRKTNNRLPCPASLGLATSSVNFGVEGPNTAHCLDNTAGNATASFSTSTYSVAEGAVPVQTLGLPDELAFDGWGNRIRYAVSQLYTANNAFITYTPNVVCASNISITDSAAITSYRTQNAIYALVSNGENSHGAYNKAGTLINTTATLLPNADEQLNCHCNSSGDVGAYYGTYAQHAPTEDPTNANNNFDDIVDYGMRFQMQTQTDYISSPATGYLYIMDYNNYRVQIFDSNGNYISQFGSHGTGSGQFAAAYGLRLDRFGNVYVMDTYNHRIQKFDYKGNYLFQFGSSGVLSGQMSFPTDIAFGLDGSIYEADSNNNRVQKFDANGNFLMQFGCTSGACVAGSGNGQFYNPWSVAVDASGNVYVGDMENSRVQKFDANGNYLSKFGSLGSGSGQFAALSLTFIAIDATGSIYVTDQVNHRVEKFDSGGNYLYQLGCASGACTPGTGNGQFNYTGGITFDSANNVYVIDYYNHRVQVFDSSGNYLRQFGAYGAGAGQLSYPMQIAYKPKAPSGYLYVADIVNNRMQVFDSDGNYLKGMGAGYNGVTGSIGTAGTGNGQLHNPLSSAFDPYGNMYVVDWANNRIQKFDPNGNYLLQWGTSGIGTGQFTQPYDIAIDGSGYVYVVDYSNGNVQKFDPNGTYKSTIGTAGTGNGQLNQPDGIAIDSIGNIYVSEYSGNRISKFDRNGNYLTQIGCASGSCTASNSDGQFNGPEGVRIDSNGNVFVTGYLNDRVQKFNSAGTFITKFGTTGSGAGQLNHPINLTLDASNNVYVTDRINYRVEKFDNNGNFLGQFGSGPGTGNGQFNYPYGITYKPAMRAPVTQGLVYVADQSNNRVQIFDTNGNYLSQFGSAGTGNGQFQISRGISVDASGNVWVADWHGIRVEKFDAYGNYLAQLGCTTGACPGDSTNGAFLYPQDSAVDADGNIYVPDPNNNRVEKFSPGGAFITKWGTTGSGPGQFNAPVGAAVDASGIVYISDISNNRVQKFDLNGRYVGAFGAGYNGVSGSIGSAGSGNGQFSGPEGIAIDAGGNVYVDEVTNNRVQKFDRYGTFINAIGAGYNGVSGSVGSTGTAAGQMNSPRFIAVDISGNLWVGDAGNNRVQKFDRNGNFLLQLGCTSGACSTGTGNGQFNGAFAVAFRKNPEPGFIYEGDYLNSRIQAFDTNGNYVTQFGSSGAGAGQFTTTFGVTPDAQGNLYAGDWGGMRMEKFDKNGTYLSVFGSAGTGSGQFNRPANIAFDAAGNMWISDNYNHRMQKFDSTGTYITAIGAGYQGVSGAIGSAGSGNGQFNYPYGPMIDPGGTVYVIDLYNDRVQKFNSSGAYLGQFGTLGIGVGQFGHPPTAGAIDAKGNVYIADYANNRIQKFTGNQWLNGIGAGYNGISGAVGAASSANGGFNYPMDVTTDSSDNTYVADGTNNRIQKFDAAGNFLMGIGSGYQGVSGSIGAAGSGNGQFNLPYSVSVDSSGNIFVPDSSNNRIQKFNSSGTYVTKWGSGGSTAGLFSNVTSIAIDSNTNLYVADSGNNRIQIFDSSGTYQSQFGTGGVVTGDPGLGIPQPYAPQHLNFDASGNIFIEDAGNYRMLKFKPGVTYNTRWSVAGLYASAIDSSGNIYTTSMTNNNVVKYDSNGNVLLTFSGPGSGNGQILSPYDIAIDSSNYVYVADTSNHRVQKFDSLGNYVTQWGTSGSGVGQFLSLVGIGFDSKGLVYTADATSNNVQVFDSSGNYQGQFGQLGSVNGQFGGTNTVYSVQADAADNIYVPEYQGNKVQKFGPGGFQLKWGSHGSGNTQFTNPQGMGNDSHGNIYVADPLNYRVMKFDAAGNFLSQLGCASGACAGGTSDGVFVYATDVRTDASDNVYVVDYLGNRVEAFNSAGTYLGQLGGCGSNACSPSATGGQYNHPISIAIGSQGTIIVGDLNNSRVQEFSPTGAFVAAWGSAGTGPGQFGEVLGVAIDATGSVYVSDYTGNRVEKLNSSGGWLGQLGCAGTSACSPGSGNGQLSGPYGLAVDANGYVYVTEAGNYRVSIFDSSGNYMGQIGTNGSANGQFRYPINVTVPPDGSVYVLEYIGERVQKFAGGWTYKSKFGSAGSGNGQFNNSYYMRFDRQSNAYVTDVTNNRVQTFAPAYVYETQWGSLGSATGQFSAPYYINASDTRGRVYVADYGNSRIQIFDRNGNYCCLLGTGVGAGAGQFASPVGVTVDSHNNVYVGDYGNSRIQKFDANGTFVWQAGSVGHGNGQFSSAPYNLAVDPNGNVWVPDSGDNRIEEFNSSGSYVGQFGTAGSYPLDITLDSDNYMYILDYSSSIVEKRDPSGTLVLQWGSSGSGPGQFTTPQGIKVIGDKVYVADSGHNRIEIFTKDGVYIGQLGKCAALACSTGTGNGQFAFPLTITSDPSGNMYVVDYSNNRVEKFSPSYAYTGQFGSSGSGTGQLSIARYLSLDQANNAIYVSNLGNSYLEKFSGNAGYLSQLGSYGSGNGQFQAERDIVIDPYNNLYTTDSTLNVVETFNVNPGNPTYVTKWGTLGSGNTQFNSPYYMGSDKSGNVYVADFGNARIQKFTGSGNYVSTITTQGTASGQTTLPTDVKVDGAGNIWVLDYGGDRLQKFNPAGVFQGQIGCTGYNACSSGGGNGQFYAPLAVAFDSKGSIYVADYGNCRVQKFDANGNFITKWGNCSGGTGPSQFNGTYNIAIDGSDNVYVADFNNNRVQKFDSQGNYISQIGCPSGGCPGGAGAGQLSGPDALAFDAAGNLYIVEDGGARVDIFNGSGSFIGKIGGTIGTGNVQFNRPYGITITPDGSLFVGEYNGNRIQKFSTNGTYLGQFGSTGTGSGQFTTAYGITLDSKGNLYVADAGVNRVQKFSGGNGYIGQFGSSGNGNGQFAAPDAITFDSDGNIYVGEESNHRIQKFSSSGDYLAKWGSTGSGNGQINTVESLSYFPAYLRKDPLPTGKVTTNPGNIYVTDFNNHRVEKFDSTGTYVSAIGAGYNGVSGSIGSSGSGNGQLNGPLSLAIDPCNNIYVTDKNNNRIQKFNSSNAYVSQWGTSGSGNGQFTLPTGLGIDANGNIYVTESAATRVQVFDSNGNYLFQWGSAGSGSGQFNNANRVTVDSKGNIYVSDSSNNRVQKFTGAGTYVTAVGAGYNGVSGAIGSSGSGNGQFNAPNFITFDAAGNMYVTESTGARVQKFDSNGNYISKWGTSGSGNGQFSQAYGIAIDDAGNIWVADYGNNRVQKFDKNGTYVSQFGSSGSSNGQLNGPRGLIIK